MSEASLIESDYAPVNGIKMYYEIHGKGFPLVLIHGGGSTIETTFGRILPLLAKNHLVIAVELQAHGRTSDRNAHETFDQDADDVAGLLNYLAISHADIFGFSNGGQTAMKIAIRHPELVRKLVIASAFYKREGIPTWFWPAMNNASFNDMPEELKDGYLAVNDSHAGLLNMFHRDAHRMQTFEDWKDEDLKSISAPSLIISGDADVVSPEHAVSMSRFIPNCQLAILPGGHGKYLGEITTLEEGKWMQEYVLELIEDFLDVAIK